MRISILLIVLSVWLAPATRADVGLISAMDDLRFQPPKDKGAVELVEGKVGKATHFRFDAGASGAFATSNLRGDPEWDRAEGFSFWVKGDGRDGFGGLEFIFYDDYAVRYDLAFPVKGTDWTRVTVAWGDLVAVLPGPRARPLGIPGGNPPSKLSALWVGKWWYWGDEPAIGFALDEIRLEPKVARDAEDHRPRGSPLARVTAKVQAGEPITVVTMGDSLTDKRHWSNREVAWVDLLKEGLKSRLHCDATVVNPAIGGTQLKQNLVLLPRWLDLAPEPDLVAIFFGGNDWDAGMRRDEFEPACEDAVDRVRRATHGKADVLLLSTLPSASRWDETSELAEACRAAAKSRNAGLADTQKAFREAGKSDRDRLYVDDRVHLSRAGHAIVAEEVLRAIGASR